MGEDPGGFTLGASGIGPGQREGQVSRGSLGGRGARRSWRTALGLVCFSFSGDGASSPLQLGMFALQLGVLATFLSEPVVKALTSGAALHVLVSQLPSLLGLPLPRQIGCFALFKVGGERTAKKLLVVSGRGKPERERRRESGGIVYAWGGEKVWTTWLNEGCCEGRRIEERASLGLVGPR